MTLINSNINIKKFKIKFYLISQVISFKKKDYPLFKTSLTNLQTKILLN